jgi:ligand-binding sensor domain-containing protein
MNSCFIPQNSTAECLQANRESSFWVGWRNAGAARYSCRRYWFSKDDKAKRYYSKACSMGDQLGCDDLKKIQ